MKILSLLLLFLSASSYSQISGCTDPLSLNYNPDATINNGSCNYKSVKVATLKSSQLSNKVKETSGVLYFDSLLWTFNDNADTSLYGLDNSGKIIKTVTIKGVNNTDWEAITQDSTSIYIGDFGNNVSGNRTDLHILKIAKNSLFDSKQQVDTISFTYSDQKDLKVSRANATDFDCEAFIIKDGAIFLFNKQWNSGATTVYQLPNNPGKQIATRLGSLDIDGLITDANYNPIKNAIVLTGYSKTLQPFLYILSDFKGNNFFSGNKRKIKLRLPFHQVEGITTTDGIHYYITNEQFSRKPFINSTPKLHQLNLSTYLP